MREEPASNVTNSLPEDPALLRCIAHIALRHAQLDYAWKTVLRDLTSSGLDEVRDATRRVSSSSLRRRVNSAARKRLGDGKYLIQLQALLERSRLTSEKRNRVMHSTWGREGDADHVVLAETNEFETAPGLPELHTVLSELEAIINNVVTARFNGFLAEALGGQPKPAFTARRK